MSFEGEPYSDDLPQMNFPWATIGLIGMCIIAYCWEIHWHFDFDALFPKVPDDLIQGYATIPARILGHSTVPLIGRHAPALLTPLTSAFLHFDIVHLFFNMMFLWVFGRHVEDTFGTGIFLALIVIAAYTANGAEIIFHPHSTTAYLGASGFIAALMGAYLAVFPSARLKFWDALPGYGFFTYSIPAWAWLLQWIVIQVWMAHDHGEEKTGTAILAHIAGFLTGVVLGRLLWGAGLVSTYADDLVDKG